MSKSGRRPTTEPFSAGYDLVHDVEIITYNDAEAVMDQELLFGLQDQFDAPVVCRVGSLHYQFKPESAVPANTVAVPERNHDDPKALLIKNE